MSWMSLLYQTYENNKAVAGKSGEKVPLSVIAHMVVNAQIEITLNQDGEFVNAREVDKKDAKTLIPVTESSAGRASGTAPHALTDTLSYIAGDYGEYSSTPKEVKKSEEKHKKYIEALIKWRDSEYKHPKVEAISHYILKNCMINDLITCGIIKLDEDQKFSLDKVGGQPYEKAMVRFRVITGEVGQPSNTWEDETLMNCYTCYYIATKSGKRDICYLSGRYESIATNHPKGIIASNYGAKLISSNDTSNFVFRGRFLDAAEACVVSYEGSQKAHSALTWLAAIQGVTIGNQEKRTYICWNPNGKKIPVLEEIFDFAEDEEAAIHTEPEYKERLKKVLQGYTQYLENNDDIVIMGLDAATTGRLSITYFNELKASDYLERLEKWGDSCNWHFKAFTQTKKPYETVKTPTIKQIVTYAFGTQHDKYIDVTDKVLKEQAQRVYYCMLDCQPVPRDLVHALFQKASNPQAYSYENHERVLSTACALIAKYYNDKKKGSVRMELNQRSHNRSYLFGRLLAIAERIEKATYKGEETRMTNAQRLQAAFVNHPMRTWSVLESALIPYYQKLTPGSTEFFKRQIEDIFELFQESDQEIMNKSLDETYLIGYYAQRKALR